MDFATELADMRNGIDGLCAMVESRRHGAARKAISSLSSSTLTGSVMVGEAEGDSSTAPPIASCAYLHEARRRDADHPQG